MNMRILAISILLITSSLVFAQQPPVSPVVVELFTAEGCSSCPPADRLLAELIAANGSGHPEVIALGEHVDYWNHDGWTDRFSSAAYTNRQNEYVSRFKLDSAYTPQIVIDGAAQFSGNNQAGVVHGIQSAAAQPKPAKLDLRWESPTRLHIAVQFSDPSAADVLLAITEDGLVTDVKNGENRGRTLQHSAVVRELRNLGKISKEGFAASVDIPPHPDWNRGHLKIVVLVQKKNQGPIVGAASTALSAGGVSQGTP